MTWHLSTVTRMNFVVKVDTAEGAKAASNGALPASEVYSMRTAAQLDSMSAKIDKI